MNNELHKKKNVSGSSRFESLSKSVKSAGASLFSKHLDVVLRFVRASVGAIILITIVSSILIPQVLPVSGNSFINAKLEWIRTPIDGDLSFGDLKIGDVVTRGTVLGTVTNERADDYFLNQLKAEKSGIESSLFALERRRVLLIDRSDVLKSKVNDSLSNIKETTNLRLSMLKNNLARSMEEKLAIRELIRRYEKANKDYPGEESFAVVSQAALQKLLKDEQSLQATIDHYKTEFELLTTNLESVLTSSYVSESTPVEQRQLLDIERQLMNIESEIEVLTQKNKKLSSRVSLRETELSKNNHYDLVAGVSGTIWDIGFPDGSYVSHGDSLVAIADTATLGVEGNFHQRYLDNVEVGDSVTVNLMGSSETLNGTVSEVKIRDQIKSADLSAINLDSPAANEFNVVVGIDDKHGRELYIGQRAKVIISKSSSSIIPSILLFFD